jgi:hypothetical protein
MQVVALDHPNTDRPNIEKRITPQQLNVLKEYAGHLAQRLELNDLGRYITKLVVSPKRIEMGNLVRDEKSRHIRGIIETETLLMDETGCHADVTVTLQVVGGSGTFPSEIELRCGSHPEIVLMFGESIPQATIKKGVLMIARTISDHITVEMQPWLTLLAATRQALN